LDEKQNASFLTADLSQHVFYEKNMLETNLSFGNEYKIVFGRDLPKVIIDEIWKMQFVIFSFVV
jgi:hypothetical protein